MTSSNPDPNQRSSGRNSGGIGNGTPKQKVEEDVQDAKHAMSAEAREKAEAGQHRLAEEAGALSHAIDAAASKLDDQDREGLARYARELSGNLANAAGQIEDRSVDELAHDAKRLARNNPALFMFGSIAVGFGLSRFFKASAEHDQDDHKTSHRTSSDRSANTLKDDGGSAGQPMRQRERDKAGTYTTSNGSDIL